MARILLAEDEHLLSTLWQNALEDAGHTVTVAHTGLQTLGYLGDREFDLLITDINMPDGGGFLVASEASRLNDRIPLIAVSGDPAILSTGVLARMPQMGADEILAKPVDLDHLLKLIETVLEKGPRKNLAERLAGLFESVGKHVRTKPE